MQPLAKQLAADSAAHVRILQEAVKEAAGNPTCPAPSRDMGEVLNSA